GAAFVVPSFPTRRSSDLTGVLFDALDYGTLEGVDDDLTLVFSALFGVTRLSDAIASYRYPATAKLPGIGNVGTWWRARLTDQLADRKSTRLNSSHVSLSY